MIDFMTKREENKGRMKENLTSWSLRCCLPPAVFIYAA